MQASIRPRRREVHVAAGAGVSTLRRKRSGVADTPLDPREQLALGAYIRRVDRGSPSLPPTAGPLERRGRRPGPGSRRRSKRRARRQGRRSCLTRRCPTTSMPVSHRVVSQGRSEARKAVRCSCGLSAAAPWSSGGCEGGRRQAPQRDWRRHRHADGAPGQGLQLLPRDALLAAHKDDGDALAAAGVDEALQLLVGGRGADPQDACHPRTVEKGCRRGPRRWSCPRCAPGGSREPRYGRLILLRSFVG